MKLIVLVFLTINLLFAENIEYSESKNGLISSRFYESIQGNRISIDKRIGKRAIKTLRLRGIEFVFN